MKCKRKAELFDDTFKSSIVFLAKRVALYNQVVFELVPSFAIISKIIRQDLQHLIDFINLLIFKTRQIRTSHLGISMAHCV